MLCLGDVADADADPACGEALEQVLDGGAAQGAGRAGDDDHDCCLRCVEDWYRTVRCDIWIPPTVRLGKGTLHRSSALEQRQQNVVDDVLDEALVAGLPDE